MNVNWLVGSDPGNAVFDLHDAHGIPGLSVLLPSIPTRISA